MFVYTAVWLIFPLLHTYIPLTLLDMVIVFIYVHFWCVLLRCSALAEMRGEGGGDVLMQTYIQSMTILVSPMSRCRSVNDDVNFPELTVQPISTKYIFLLTPYVRSTQLEQIAQHAHGCDSCPRTRTLND